MDPYEYTSGRWLHLDEQRRASRHLQFDFTALLQRVIKASPGATKVAHCSKFEGGFNRVFVIDLDNAEKLVAKLPFKHSGATGLRTNSEVATIAYIKAQTKIPVPAVLDWSDSAENEIGSEFIIMRHAQGVSLHEAWPLMNGRQQLDCVRRLAETMRDLSRLKFPAFGCIYFDGDAFSNNKISLGNGFCIGPNCHPNYWSNELEPREYARVSPNQGPWTDLPSYTDGLLDAGMSRIPLSESVNRPEYFGQIDTHISLLSTSQKVLSKLITSQLVTEIAAPMLLHPDLHKRNIFVSTNDSCSVSCLVDWQFASISPTFQYADETPDFLFPHDINEDLVASKLGEEATSVRRDENAQKINQRFELIQKMYTTALKGWLPSYWRARTANPTLLRLFRYCGTSWSDGATALRQELIDLSQQWSALALPFTCPYEPSEKELHTHARLFAEFERRNELKLMIIQLVNCDADGWVPAECYEAAKDICHEAYVEYLKEAETDTELKLSKAQAKSLWPFDAQ